MLPLETLLIQLEKAGFSCGVDMHLRLQTVLQRLGNEYLEEPEKLKLLLAPILTKSPEEVQKFELIFEEYYEHIVQVFIRKQFSGSRLDLSEGSSIIEINPEAKKYTSPFRKYWPLITLCLGALALFLFFLQNAQNSYEKPDFEISDMNGKLVQDAMIHVGQTVQLKSRSEDYLRFRYKRKMRAEEKAKLEYEWDIGGERILRGKEHTYTFEKEGLFKIKKKISFWIGDSLETAFVEHSIRVVCESKPKILFIEWSPPQPQVNEPVSFDITFSGGFKGDNIRWVDNDDPNPFQERDYSPNGSIFDEERIYTLRPEYTLEDRKNNPCSILDTLIKIQVHRYSTIQTVLEPEDTFVESEAETVFEYSLSYGATIFPSLLLFALVFFVNSRRLRKRRDALLGPAKAKRKSLLKGPLEIPLPNMDMLLSSGPNVFRISKMLRQRRQGPRKKLDIRQTLKATTQNLGMLSLRYLSSSQASEYLILIEQRHPQSHLMRLFNRYVRLLKDENVVIERFFFDQDMRLCWNEDYPQGINLAQLRQKLPRHRLIMFTDGHHMIDAYEAKLKDWVIPALEVWKKRMLILSHVLPRDWTYKERLLHQHFNLLSADPVDQDRIIEFYSGELPVREFEEHRAISILSQEETEESLQEYDFEDIEDLRLYLNDALFEWLGALMVHPSLSWEMTLAIGHALSTRKNAEALLSYTNILRLARIPWMQTGLISPALRLELLDSLDRDAEHLARQTLSELLDKVSTVEEISEDSHAFRKLNVQKISNQFLTNPIDKELSEKMYVLWEQNKIVDKGIQSRMEMPLLQLHGEKATEYLRNRYEGITPMKTLAMALLLTVFMGIATFFLHQKYDRSEQLAELSENLFLDKLFFTRAIEKLDSAAYFNDVGVAAVRESRLLEARVNFYNAIQFKHFKRLKAQNSELIFSEFRKNPMWNLRIQAYDDPDTSRIDNSAYSKKVFSVIMDGRLNTRDSLENSEQFDELLLRCFYPDRLRVDGEQKQYIRFEEYPEFDDKPYMIPAYLFVKEYPKAGQNLLKLTMYNEGVEAFNAGDLDEALKHFENDRRLLQGELMKAEENLLQPLYIKVVHGCGLSAFYLGDLEKARAYKAEIDSLDRNFFAELVKPEEHLAKLLGESQIEKLSEEELWQEAIAENKIELYEKYLNEYPAAKYVELAREKIAELSNFTQGLVRGLVLNNSKEGLTGANILVKGTNKGTITDVEGKFSLEGLEKESSLIVSYTGFKNKEVFVSSNELEIILEPIPVSELNGRVVDEARTPIEGAKITLLGIGIERMTDDKGEFSIQLPEEAESLLIQHPDYESQNVGVGKEKLEVRLKQIKTQESSIAEEQVQEEDSSIEPITNCSRPSDAEMSAALTTKSEELEAQKLMYSATPPEELRDATGIFFRMISFVGSYVNCSEYVYPKPEETRTTKSLVKWFYQRGNLVIENDTSKILERLRPGSVLFFGRWGKEYTPEELTIDVISGSKGVQHMGIVTEILRDESGETIGYKMMNGRSAGKHAKRTLHYRNPPGGFPGLG
ncbi:MAG: carboxypeptidase-like regulatory domain-containing protein, partial [Bacteroidota bacterium]